MRPSCLVSLTLTAMLSFGCGSAQAPVESASSVSYAERSLVSTTISSPVDFSIARAPSRVESSDCQDGEVTLTRKTDNITTIEPPLIGEVKDGHIRLVVPKAGDYTLRYLASRPCKFKVLEPVDSSKR